MIVFLFIFSYPEDFSYSVLRNQLSFSFRLVSLHCLYFPHVLHTHVSWCHWQNLSLLQPVLPADAWQVLVALRKPLVSHSLENRSYLWSLKGISSQSSGQSLWVSLSSPDWNLSLSLTSMSSIMKKGKGSSYGIVFCVCRLDTLAMTQAQRIRYTPGCLAGRTRVQTWVIGSNPSDWTHP